MWNLRSPGSGLRQLTEGDIDDASCPVHDPDRQDGRTRRHGGDRPFHRLCHGRDDAQHRLAADRRAVARAAGRWRLREGDRRQDQLAEVRRRRRRDRRHRLGLAGYRLCRFVAAHRGGQPRGADRDHLRRRPDRPLGSAGGQGRRQARGSHRQEDRDALRFHRALQPADGAEALEHRSEEARDPQPQAAGNRRRLGTRRHRRRLCLGSGAGRNQEDRQGGRHLQRRRPMGRPDLRRLDRPQGIRRAAPRRGEGLRQGDRRGLRLLSRRPEEVGRQVAGGREDRPPDRRQAGRGSRAPDRLLLPDP